MSIESPTNQLVLHRDGTSQAARQHPALDPDSVHIDERSLKDFLAFTREYAKELKFYSDENQEDGDWSGFLGENIDLDEAVAFMNDPKNVVLDNRTRFTRPHFVLFLTFLKLLRHAQDGLNTLTRRHLDFYFQEILGLHPKEAVPDRLHVLVELARGQDQFLLPAGSQLLAGQDNQGTDLIYQTDHDRLVNRAQVASLKSLFVQRRVIGLQEVYEHSQLVSVEDPFIAMLILAIGESETGEPKPGGALSNYPGKSTPPDEPLFQILDRLLRFIVSDFDEEEHRSTGLHMHLAVFRTLMELKRKLDDSQDRWNQVNAILQTAGRKMRNDASYTLTPSAPDDFTSNLNEALDSPNFDGLPDVEDIHDLYRQYRRLPPDDADRAKVEEFIDGKFKREADEEERGLHMSQDDFVTMMEIVTDINQDWWQIYDILQAAGRRKQRKDGGLGPIPTNDVRTYDPDKFNKFANEALGDRVSNTNIFKVDFTLLADLAIIDLDGCYQAVLDLEGYLFLSAEEYVFIRTIHAIEQDSKIDTLVKPWQWQQVYETLRKAHRQKTLPKRWDVLKQKHLENADDPFDALIKFALGDPQPGDELPQSREFMSLNPSIEDNELYIREKLHLEVVNFEYIKRTQERHLDPQFNVDVDDWNKVYIMLEQAQRRKRGWEEPRAEIEEWENIYAAADATQVQVNLDLEKEEDTLRWRTFGEGHRAEGEPHTIPATIGLAIASPLLALAEGKRVITLTIRFKEEAFEKTTIDQTLGTNPFRFLLSTEEEMIEIETATVEILQSGGTQEPALKMTLELDEQMAPIAPLAQDAGLGSPWPLLQIQLRDIDASDTDGDEEQRIFSTKQYLAFQSLVIEEVNLHVSVQNITELILQNDDTVLNAKKPFEPFGISPLVGSSFYVAHPELCSKKLDTLELEIDWMGVPENLQNHYVNYSKSSTLTNVNFKAEVKLYDNRSLFSIGHIPLFKNNATDTNNVAPDLNVLTTSSNYDRLLHLVTAEEALEWNRYWQLELAAPDFQHTVYPTEAADNASKTTPPTIINPPYAPKIKRLAIHYSSSAEIDLTESNLTGSDATSPEQLYHIEPFGYHQLRQHDNGPSTFLPQFLNEGELYIGIRDLVSPTNLSLLFQVAEGSADPDVTPVTVHWDYLSGNQWSNLEEKGQLLSDAANGLLNSGVMTFELPQIEPNTRLPADLYWIRARIARHSHSVAHMVAIRAQAVSATFVDRDNASDHLEQPVQSNRITGLIEPLPQIKDIDQPFSSFGGKPREGFSPFYTRVSERLRHKDRSLTSWDYERMVLEAFPEIYKVKCVPVETSNGSRDADRIQIIVIPDIRGKLPSDPYQPKAAADTLQRIEQFLVQHITPLTRLEVKNPQYMQLKVRFAVHLRQGFDPGYYKSLLNEELQRYLAPWAYDDSAEIVFGGRINAHLIVHFLELRHYVDYVAGVKLSTSLNNEDFRRVADLSIVPANTILVSARQHDIDLIAEEGFDDELFTGINYMQVELDFQVAPDAGVQTGDN